MYNCVSSACRWWFSECKDMSELSGVGAVARRRVLLQEPTAEHEL